MSELPFSEDELRAALAPHLPADEAAAEARTIAGTLRDSAMTGATLNDDILAMLHASGLGERVAAYRAAALARRREVWLRRERRFGGSDAEELAARWGEYEAQREAEWVELLPRVEAAVAQARLRAAGVDSPLVQLGRRPKEGEEG